jgi:thiosulfate sulfurtransferase
MTKLMRIDCETASEIYLQDGSQLIDIRDQESYLAGHIGDAIHIDNSSLSQFIASAETSQPLLIYCYHGNSSQQAGEYFINQGFEQVYSVDGGFEQWQHSPPITKKPEA